MKKEFKCVILIGRGDIKNKLEMFQPDIIALSTTEDMWLLGTRLLEEIEEFISRHKIPVIAGGVFPTLIAA
jgi:hypothetical protein